MRYFTLTKEEFDHLIYPAAIRPAVKVSIYEQRLASKAMEALEEAGELTPMSLLEILQEKALPLCQMRGVSHDFALEDAVHEALVKQLHRYIPAMPAGLARVALRIADRIEKAPSEPPARREAV